MRMTIGKLLAVIALFIVLSTGTGFCFGVNYGWATVEPQIQVIEKEVPVEVERFVVRITPVEVEKIVEKEVPVYIDRIATENITVEKVVEVPVGLKGFASVEEARGWLGPEGHYAVFGEDGNLLKCDGMALWLIEKAKKDGYLMYYQAIYPNIYNPLFHKMQITYATNGGLHAICALIIGKEFYYVEPQTREMVLGGYLN